MNRGQSRRRAGPVRLYLPCKPRQRDISPESPDLLVLRNRTGLWEGQDSTCKWLTARHVAERSLLSRQFLSSSGQNRNVRLNFQRTEQMILHTQPAPGGSCTWTSQPESRPAAAHVAPSAPAGDSLLPAPHCLHLPAQGCLAAQKACDPTPRWMWCTRETSSFLCRWPSSGGAQLHEVERARRSANTGTPRCPHPGARM